jgi:hypothetical protein
MIHMGNVTWQENRQPVDQRSGANLESLEGIVATAPYLSPHSDLVALMVLEHQSQTHNAITAANFETREALHQTFEMNELLGREAGFISETSERRIGVMVERLVSHLLMCHEFRLTDPVAGTSPFAEEFMQRGVRDSQGRSLRDLDLQTRLFRYPCSYLIYSPSFDALPGEIRKRVIGRLKEILGAADESPGFAHLTAPLRREILEILAETKTEFGAQVAR